MRVDQSTQRQIDDHLQQAEFSLRVVANFPCLTGTPVLEKVGIAQTKIQEARAWTQLQLPVVSVQPSPGPLPSAGLLVRRRRLGIR